MAIGEDTKAFITAAAGVVTILGFFGLRTIFDVVPKEAESLRPTEEPASHATMGGTYTRQSDPSTANVSEVQVRGSGEALPQLPAALPSRTSPSSETPFEFTLMDGEQKFLLSGRAAVGAQFNQIGEEQFLTLRVNIGDESTPYVVLAPGAHLTLWVQEEQYYLSLLRLDFPSRTARLRIDRAQ